MRLPDNWNSFLTPYFNLSDFYQRQDMFLSEMKFVIPDKSKIFNVFNYMNPQEVKCVLYGEDPYPRSSSAIGIAFWDAEIKDWRDKTNGNSLKNILKALLVDRNIAEYKTPIAHCREIAFKNGIPSPGDMFRSWLRSGVLLINTALTYSGKENKMKHFKFWLPFHLALIEALNKRDKSPFYVLWGNKAGRWEGEILKSIDSPDKIIKQGHPTFIHQFLNKNNTGYSPFTEIREKTGIKWI